MQFSVSSMLSVRACLGVAWSAHFVLHLMAEGDGSHTPTTTDSLDNSSYTTFNTTGGNFTFDWSWLWNLKDKKEESKSLFESSGFINGIVTVFCAVIGVAIYVIRKRYRDRLSQSPVPVVEGPGAAPPPPPGNNGAPVPQTWDLSSAGNASSFSSLSSPSTVTSQPLSVLSTSSASGIDYSNNNFLSNYSSSANYSSLSKF